VEISCEERGMDFFGGGFSGGGGIWDGESVGRTGMMCRVGKSLVALMGLSLLGFSRQFALAVAAMDV